LVFAGSKGKTSKLLSLIRRERLNVIVKARNGNPPIFIAKLSYELTERDGRVIDRAAKNSRMQIAVRSMQSDFKGSDTSESVSQSGMFGRRHAGVRDDDCIATQFSTIRAQE